MQPEKLDELLRRARNREAEALTQLIELFSQRVFGLLFSLTGSRPLAEDLLQETFVRVVRMIGDYEHTGRFESWLFRIAANLARDRARSQRRRGLTTSLDSGDGAPGVQLPADGFTQPDARLLAAETSERLALGLSRLSEPDREILLLRHYSGMPFQEIATMLNVPLGTALARAHRALQRLRTEMGDES